MKTKSRNLIVVFLMVFAFVCGVFAITPLTAHAQSGIRVDFCLTNGALENDVKFENAPTKYFVSQLTENDGTLVYLEELYRTDSLELEFDGWYTEDDEKVTTETVFTEYTILYDRWKPTTLTSDDIISNLEIDTPLLEVGKTVGVYDKNSVSITDNRLTVADVSVYEGLNAYRTNKLDSADVLETGKSYSIKIELHAQNGKHIDSQLFSHISTSYGLTANILYSHDNSGIYTTQWTNKENKIQVVINYDYENYYFTADFADKIVENNQPATYTIYVSNTEKMQSAKLYVLGAGDTWSSLGEINGQFNVPANSNIVKQYKVEVTYQNGFVISSNTFKVDWYDPNSPKFVTQPMDYNVSYGTNVLVTWGLNCDVSAIYLEKFDGENYSQYQNATPTGATVNAFVESGTYTFRVHAIKDGVDYYSDDFTITWREKFVFTTQPQSMTVATGEEYTITWETNEIPSILQVWSDDGNGNYARSFSITDATSTSYTFNASDFAYSQNYKLMVNYDSVVYFSDIFTIEIVAGEFTQQPDSEINAIIGNDCLVEWDFSLKVAYYNIKVYEGNDFVQFATTDKPEYVFTASEGGYKQYFVQAYNSNHSPIGDAYLMFTITWTEEQVVFLVSFNANGGTGTMASVEQNAESQYTLPTCTFTAPDGKKFKAWSVNGEQKQPNDSITINANTVVKAVWEDNVYQVIYQPGDGNGSNETYEYEANETITFLDCEEFGYIRDGFEFDYWSIRILGDNFTEVEQKRVGETYTLTTNIIAVAMWKEVTAVPTGITATYSGTILAGNKINPSSILITLNYSNSSNEPVNAGIVEYWYNGSQIQDPINYVFGVELIGNLNITVKYQGFETTMAVQVVGYEITFNANTGSGIMESVEYVGAYTLPACTFTAPTGKQFKGWATSANGEVIGATYNVTANVEFYAIWENIPVTNYTITATAGANGTISPSGEVTVAEGEDKTFTITANTGYHIKDVKVNGSSVGAVATYTFTNVTANATITIEFEVDTVPHVCNPTLVPEDEPDCTTAGKSAYYHCECGKNYEDAQGNTEIENIETWGILNALNHEAKDTWSSDADNHWKECARCSGQQLEKAAHSGGTATCTEKAVCATCNTAYGNTIAHSHGSEWKTDANEHWNECACGDKANKAAHTDSNNDGKCDTCEYQMTNGGGNTETPDNPNNTPDNPNNTPDDPTDDKDGLGAGAIVGIVSGSVAVVGVGGFALFWFVIKKKTWAEFLAIFKKK